MLSSNVAGRMPQERRTLRIAMNIAALVAMGALLMSAMACSEDSTGVTPTAQPTTTSRPADAVATSIPSPTATSSPDDTVSSADPQPSPEPTRSVPDDMVKTLAPIDSVEIRVAESYPQQYFVGVVSGLPNACVEFYGYEERRSGSDITITVYNLEPPPSQKIVCAEIYGTHEFVLPLGSDFQPGETYTLRVNDTLTTFDAE